MSGLTRVQENKDYKWWGKDIRKCAAADNYNTILGLLVHIHVEGD